MCNSSADAVYSSAALTAGALCSTPDHSNRCNPIDRLIFMSILRSAALLAARAGCVCAGPGLPSQLGALSALQHKLGGLIQPAGWLQARGFAAPSGGGTGGSGSGGEQQPPRPDAQPQQPAAAAAAASQKSGDEQQAAASAQQAEAPRPEPEQPAEQQAQQGDAAGSQQPPSPEVEQDPRLAKFVEGLKQLKGGGSMIKSAAAAMACWVASERVVVAAWLVYGLRPRSWMAAPAVDAGCQRRH